VYLILQASNHHSPSDGEGAFSRSVAVASDLVLVDLESMLVEETSEGDGLLRSWCRSDRGASRRAAAMVLRVRW